MKLSDITPIPALHTMLTDAGVTETIYEGSKPTSDLPDAYIELLQNGAFKTKAQHMGIVNGVLLVAIHVKLLPNGTINTVKENLIMKKFDTLFENSKTAVSGTYHFRPDPDNLVYGGRGIQENYSSKIINVLVTKINS